MTVEIYTVKDKKERIAGKCTLWRNDAPNHCLCLDSGYTLPVVVHELLHAFHIPHSFSNEYFCHEAKFCYIYKTTDNLLDYSEGSQRKSTWKWQWEIANKSINEDGSISPEKQKNE